MAAIPTRSVSIRFDFKSYWHMGTGRGAGPELAAAVHRTPEQLPFIPGRTVAGLLRQAMELASELGAIERSLWPDATPAEWCFGTAQTEVTADDRIARQEAGEFRFETRPGNLRIESAVLGRTETEAAAWCAFAAAPQNQSSIRHLYSFFASTRLAASGIAEDETLRGIEVVVPVMLHARITGPEARPWTKALESSVGFIRAVGSHRHRGLGRVAVTLDKELV